MQQSGKFKFLEKVHARQHLRVVSNVAYTAGWPKNGTVFWYALTSSNINRFSKLFHCQNQEKMCNNTITKYLTTPQVCRYTTL